LPLHRPDNDVLRRLVLWLGVTGTVVFSLLLALAYLQPVTIEKWARAAIAMEVQSRVQESLQSLDDAVLVKSAKRILARKDKQLADAQAARLPELPSAITVIMVRMLDPDCACRQGLHDWESDVQRARKWESDVQGARIADLVKQKTDLTRLVEAKYRDVAQSLLREVKIFSAANATVFLLLALTAARWKRPGRQLLAPAGVMAGACVFTSAVYLFNQDWLGTILFNDYVGLFYIPYLLATLSFLADGVFNRGRITLTMLDLVLTVVGGMFSAAAC
jgi:hypothetical protein